MLGRRLALVALFAGSACDRAPAAVPPPPPPPTEPKSSAAPIASATPSASASTGPERAAPIVGMGPGFPVAGPWVSFYGSAAQMGDLAKVAATYRILDIDVDPGARNFTDAQIKQLQAGGKNKVISYMNVGACEHSRDYWSSAPDGFVPCGRDKAAHLGAYEGYADETWMNPASADYRKLVVEHIASRLAARGIDGFYLDNLELLSHGTKTKNGPCNAACKQAGLDLVRALRTKFPNLLIVMQNGTTDVTRLGTTGGIPFPALLDGIAHEEVYAPKPDPEAERELLAWKAMAWRSRDGHPLWIAVEDYVGSCKNKDGAKAAIDKSKANGFSPYVSDESGGQHVVCFW